MKSPVDASRPLRVLASTGSTQDDAARFLRKDEPWGAVLTHDQTGGRGRQGRVWWARAGDSLAVSMIFRDYRNHTAPWLIGMAVGIATAQAASIRLRWPNDLFWQGKKVGGILTEIIDGVPVVGLGMNLNQTAFPSDITELATSLRLIHGGTYTPEPIFAKICESLKTLREPSKWQDLEPAWKVLDQTPGKHYRLHNGREIVAAGVDGEGRLLGEDGTVVTAAEAIFGTP
ncbi:hypothetical protein BH11ARM2_BH11ARM2_33590 [soil metagenome]